MLLSKRCPKCGGNLLISTDYYGNYAACMQCGRAIDLPRKRDTSIGEPGGENVSVVGLGQGRHRR